MSQVIVLQHLDREGCGYIADLCTRRGLTVTTVRLDLGVPVPESLAEGDLLVVMGGSMGVGDIGDPRYPFLAREASLLRSVLAKEQPVLGICLGSQLLAHAAGARVFPNQRPDQTGAMQPCREVGFGRVRLLHRPDEPAWAGLTETIPVLHWHGDTFDLPAGAVHLAESELCKHQAFRLGKRAYGLQFHIETDAELVRTWAREDAAFAESALGPTGPADIVAASEAGSREVRQVGERILNNVLEQMLTR
jgi:GMP synthase (glutamine-hydrolysing)